MGPSGSTTTIAGFSIIGKLTFLLGIIAFLIYANTLGHGYVLDDYIVIVKNNIVTKGFSGIGEIFTTPYHFGHSPVTNDLYRPLAMVMFAVEWQLSGGGAWLSHFINTVVFAGCVMLLFMFVDELFDKRKTVLAFVAALLFALHPIHTEVVANIKSRDELMCFLCAFGSLLLFMKHARSGKIMELVAGAVLYFLALLSKETAITFIGVIPLVFFFYKNDNRGRSIMITAGAVIAAAAYLAIRFSVLAHYNANHSGEVSFIDNVLSGAPTSATKFATAIYIMGNYIRMLFVPYPLICDYSYSGIPFVGFGNTWVLLSFAAYLALVVFALLRMLKNRKDPAAFGILFFLITISLFSNIPFLVGAAMAERFVFFASAGFCIAISRAVDKWVIKDGGNNIDALKRGTTLFVLLPVCLVYSGITFARNGDWKSNNSLYAADVVKAPENSRLHYYLGTDLLISEEADGTDVETKKQLATAGIEHLKTAVAIYPGFSLVISEIGSTYFNIKNYDSAAIYFEKALTINGKDTLAMHNLSAVYFFKQEYEKSVAQCRSAIALDPNYGRGYRNMGSCYLKMGKYDSAIQVLRIAAIMDPAINSSYQNLAYSFKLGGNMDSARKYEAIARQRNPAFSLDASTMK